MEKDIKTAMKNYIARTNLYGHGFQKYGLKYSETICLRNSIENGSIIDALFLAFQYGACKGYRCAMKNEKKSAKKRRANHE